MQDTDLLAFVTVDTETRSRFASIEANRRVGASGEIRLEARFCADADPADPLYSLLRDDYLQLVFVHYF